MSDAHLSFDAAIIGGGSGGYAAARTLAAAGLKTAVIDSAPTLGGLCILRGCMPTKALLHSAEIAHLTRHASEFGIQSPPPQPNLPAVMARKKRLIDDFASYRQKQLQDGRFTLLRTHARFTSPHTLHLGPLGTLQASSFVIATGSKVAPPPLPTLQNVGYWTSDDALEITQLPSSLIVLGGGAVAVEFAQFFQRMGTHVTLIQRSPHLLRDFDPEAGLAIQKSFERDGMTVHTNTRLLDAGTDAQGKWISFEKNGQIIQVHAQEILHALGRSPNTDTLDLHLAGVETVHGRIQTNFQQQTTQPHIFACGDCTGPHEIVHIAILQGEISAHNILHPARPKSMDYRLLLSVVFTDPQAASVGLTEQQAQRLQIPYLTASYPFNDHGKSMILGTLEGDVKLLCHPQTGEILGGTCTGPQAGELIHEIVVAMAAHLTVAQLAAIPHYHPTLAEIWTYPAEELASQIPTLPPTP